MKQLSEHIKKNVSITDNDLHEISNSFQSKVLEKDAYLMKAGQYCDSYYFVAEGALKIYTSIDDNEITSWFAFKDYFFTELESYTTKSQTRFNIQAVEKSHIYFIPHKTMDVYIEKYPKWHEFVRKTWESSFIKLQQVVLSFQAQTAEERYEDLFKYPDFIQKTKQRDLASMIGITRFSLSRLRRKK